MNPRSVAEKLVERIKKADPAADALVRVHVGRSANTRYAVNEITTSGETDADTVGVTIALGQRHASATSNRFEDDALGELVARAFAMAKLSPEDPEWVGVLGAQETKPSPHAFDEATAALGSEARAAMAKKAIAAAKEKGVVGAGFAEVEAGEHALATSAGLSVSHRSTELRFSSTARSEDGTGSGWAGIESPRVGEVDAEAVARSAADKALRSRGPRDLEPGRYTVVLEPGCLSVLMGFFIGAMDARKADEGRSYFTKPGGGSRIGETLFHKSLSLRSDPFDAATPSAPFDGEGLALAPTTWIDGGKVAELSRSRFWAKTKGGRPTGEHRAFHLQGAGGAADTDALVRQVDRGLLVTRFWYVRWLDPKTMTVTGLTRDGVFLIEKGAVTAPVKNFRFNDSPARVLADAAAWTSSTARLPSWGGTVRVPTLVTSDFLMASKSAAV